MSKKNNFSAASIKNSKHNQGQAMVEFALVLPILLLVVTCALEVLQLWHPWFLEKVRSTFLGKALIGTTFVWWDFPHYFLGSLIGWVWLKRIFQLDVK